MKIVPLRIFYDKVDYDYQFSLNLDVGNISYGAWGMGYKNRTTARRAALRMAAKLGWEVREIE